MPNYVPKCWGFDDNGVSTGKCKRSASDCRFAHPGSVNWERGRRLPNQGAHRKSGSFTGSNQGMRDSDYSDSWKSPSDAHPPAPTSTNTIKLPETGSRWGTSSSAIGDKSQASGSNTGWPKSSGDTQTSESTARSTASKPDASGWGSGSGLGNQASSPGWGNKANSPGWGSERGWGSGWGNSGMDKDKDKDNAWSGTTTWSANWSEGANPGSGRGSGTGTEETPIHDTKGKGKEKEAQSVPMRAPSPPRRTSTLPQRTQPAAQSSVLDSQDVSMRAPSPPRKALPLPQRAQPVVKPDNKSSVLDSGKSSTPTIPRRPLVLNVNTSRKEHDIDKPRKSSTPTTPHLPIPKIPKKVHRQSFSQPEDLKVVYKELAATKQDKSMTSKSSSYPAKYIGPEGRKALYTDILTYMQDVVISEIAYREAKTTYEKWKVYHDTSPNFFHATPATRTILEGIRGEYHKKLTDTKLKRDTVLLQLGDLPDFLPSEPINDPTVTKEMVMNYTNELRSWFLDLKIHERLAVEKKERELKAKELESQAAQMDAQQQPTASELLEQGNWDWRELKAALKLAEDSVTAATEQVYSSVWTNHDLLDEHLRQLPTADQPVGENFGADTRPGGYAALENMLKTIDVHLSVQSGEAGAIITRVNKLEEEIANLRVESVEINRLCDEAEQQFAKFEEEKNEMHEEAESLQYQLANLHLHKWSGRRPTSPELLNETVQPVLDEILPHFRERMQRELQQILDLLRQRGLENQAEMGRQVEEMLKPLLTQTDEIETICQTFITMNVVQDPAPPVVSMSTSAAH